MFKAGSMSRWLAGAFLMGALVIGTIGQMTSTRDAANLTNTVRDTGEQGAGVIVGSLSGAGGEFERARRIAAAPDQR